MRINVHLAVASPARATESCNIRSVIQSRTESAEQENEGLKVRVRALADLVTELRRRLATAEAAKDGGDAGAVEKSDAGRDETGALVEERLGAVGTSSEDLLQGIVTSGLAGACEVAPEHWVRVKHSGAGRQLISTAILVNGSADGSAMGSDRKYKADGPSPGDFAGSAAGWLVEREEIERGKVIGRGTHGTVHLGRFRGAAVAVKCVRMEDNRSASRLLRELEALVSCRSNHVCAMLAACLTEVGGSDSVVRPCQSLRRRRMSSCFSSASGFAFSAIGLPIRLLRLRASLSLSVFRSLSLLSRCDALRSVCPIHVLT